MSSPTYVGLDGEMSAANLDEGGKLIQIGFALWRGHNDDQIVFTKTINPAPEEMLWEEEAAAVHKITREEIAEAADRYTADADCYAFLVGSGAGTKRRAKTIAVGFNVGAFDMPFVRHMLPKTNSLFSRQTVDLNAVCFALSIHTRFAGKLITMGAWKTLAKEYAAEQSKVLSHRDWHPHNAGYDASNALYAFEFLSKAAGKSPL